MDDKNRMAVRKLLKQFGIASDEKLSDLLSSTKGPLQVQATLEIRGNHPEVDGDPILVQISTTLGVDQAE
jgi:hypothetical protein